MVVLLSVIKWYNKSNNMTAVKRDHLQTVQNTTVGEKSSLELIK